MLGLQNMPASDIHVKRFKHQEVAQDGKLVFPCADGSLKLFDLSSTFHARKCPPGETLSKMKKWRGHNLAVSLEDALSGKTGKQTEQKKELPRTCGRFFRERMRRRHFEEEHGQYFPEYEW